tara:strand:+ start:161 stop:550 length:390 start_codon:yes stop_codon:yes gene_type:complete
MIIDFTKKGMLTESWLKQFGAWNKFLLKHMYGDDVNMVAPLGAHGIVGNMFKEEESDQVDSKVKFIVRGEQKDVKAYAKAIVREKEYLDMYLQYGNDHPQTLKAREVLNQAVDEFQNRTGITWPFKDED